MRTLFNWNTFKGYLQEEVSDFEYNFLKRVFSQAALSFGGFGAAVCVLSAISKHVAFMKEGSFQGACFVAALISGAALMFYYLPKYHSNPMDVSPKFVRRAYITLMITYGTIFVALLKGLELLRITGNANNFTNLAIGGALFGTTLLVYAIPAAVGFFMQKHNTALRLARLVRNCYIAYAALFLLGLLIAIISLSSKAGNTLTNLFEVKNVIMMLLYGVIVFVSPILSIYRMKMVTRYLDERDPVAIKKWELFFVFEILVQLMQMAIYIVRMAFSCLSCSTRR